MALVIAAGTYTLCVVARYQRWCEFAPVTHDWHPSRDPRWVSAGCCMCGSERERTRGSAHVPVCTYQYGEVLFGNGLIRPGGRFTTTIIGSKSGHWAPTYEGML